MESTLFFIPLAAPPPFFYSTAFSYFAYVVIVSSSYYCNTILTLTSNPIYQLSGFPNKAFCFFFWSL